MIFKSLLIFGACMSLTSHQPSYVLATGKLDETRLTILNELHNPATLSKLDILPGMRILTVGCGIGLLEQEMAEKVGSNGFVLGTDISAEQIAIAKQKSHFENLEFLQIEALNIHHVKGLFNRIHCRYVLTHLPWEKILEIIPLLYSKLAPGGLLLLEECATLDSLFCEPSHSGYDKWKLAAYKQFASQKSDTSPGLKILRYLQENQYPFLYSSYQKVLSTPREKSLLSLGVLSARQRFLQDQTFSSEELEKMLEQLYELEQDSAYLPRYNEVSQIILFKP
jgi:ubiquinone/menaquinone biosynthesis C-methylase UbiE